MVRQRAKLGGCTFKLLLTTPGVLQLDAASVLDDETEVVNCPEKFESGDGFADTVWDSGASEDIEGLTKRISEC
jgi:hypothetical protein